MSSEHDEHEALPEQPAPLLPLLAAGLTFLGPMFFLFCMEYVHSRALEKILGTALILSPLAGIVTALVALGRISGKKGDGWGTSLFMFVTVVLGIPVFLATLAVGSLMGALPGSTGGM